MRPTTLDEILQRLQQTQQELEQELDRLLEQKREQFQYHLQLGKVVFEKSIRHWQKQYRTGVWRYLRKAPLTYILSAPIVYGMVIPMIILDISITLYQHICFRIYQIPRVRRSEYLLIDRHHLAYLNVIEKLNCLYCGYGNGVIEYSREITARTEQYWCPIKHARRTLDEHVRTQHFFDYGDAESYRQNLKTLRKNWGNYSETIDEKCN